MNATRRCPMAVTVAEIIEAAGRTEEFYDAMAGKGDFHLRIERPSPSIMPLVIECHDTNTVSVSHYYEQNGDLMADPDIVFLASPQGWKAIEYTQHNLNIYQCAGEGRYLPSATSFSNGTWARNIREQGFVEAAKNQAMATR